MNTWQELEATDAALLGAHGGEPVVAVRPSLVRALHGNGNAAIMLSQLLYWSARTDDPDGWFYNKQSAIEEQTGLGSDAQLKARKFLKSLGLIEDKLKGVPPTVFYRVNLALVAQIIRENTVIPISAQSRKLKSDLSRNTISAQSRKLNSDLGRKSYKDTEITTESTEEITSNTECVSTNNVPVSAPATAAATNGQPHTQPPSEVLTSKPESPTVTANRATVVSAQTQRTNEFINASMDYLGKTLDWQMRRIYGTERQGVIAFAQVQVTKGRDPSVLAEFERKWPQFCRKRYGETATKPTLKQFLERFDDVLQLPEPGTTRKGEWTNDLTQRVLQLRAERAALVNACGSN